MTHSRRPKLTTAAKSWNTLLIQSKGDYTDWIIAPILNALFNVMQFFRPGLVGQLLGLT